MSGNIASVTQPALEVWLTATDLPSLSLPPSLRYVMQKEGVKPSFYFPEGEEPKQVDWVRQRDQIDAARELGVKHVVLISSMGGTQPDHFLNSMGNGKILLWKRKVRPPAATSSSSSTTHTHTHYSPKR